MAVPAQPRASAGLSIVGSPDDSARVFLHLTADSLEKLTLHNPSPLKALIAGTLAPAAEDGCAASIDEEKLVILLRTLTSEFARLDGNDAAAAILALLDFDRWSAVSPRVTDCYIQFCNVLVSGSPKWWSEIARRVVGQFQDPALDHAPHHAILTRVLRAVPTATTSLAQILAGGFPHKSSSADALCTYTRNLLALLVYAPEQSSAVWKLVVQKLVEIDVELDAEYEDASDDDDDDEEDVDDDNEDSSADEHGSTSNDESATSADVHEPSDADLDAAAGGAPARTAVKRAAGDTDFEHAPAKRLSELQDGEVLTAVELALAQAAAEPPAVKTDRMLALLLEHFSRAFAPAAVRCGEATPLFKTLLQVFRAVVLPTARPQAVQFIWFYITSTHRDFESAFLAVLLETVLDDAAGMDLRCRALQYIASYVARARSLAPSQVEYVVTFLAEYVTKFVDEREGEVDASLSMARFRIFYAAVQALFYIFMFRHAQLRDSAGWVANLDKTFQRLITTKFNPLQYCMPDVVAMFARIAQHEEVASCYSIIERNRWGRFRTGDKQRAHDGHSGLFAYNRDSKLYDAFFPYQPLRLPAARRFVEDLYNEWTASAFSDSDSEYSDSE